MRVIIHETYEYEVEADSAEEARDLFEAFMTKFDADDTGVKFNQNYLHTYDTEGNEL